MKNFLKISLLVAGVAAFYACEKPKEAENTQETPAVETPAEKPADSTSTATPQADSAKQEVK
jgi:hypothetical protein